MMAAARNSETPELMTRSSSLIEVGE